ncbi:MAG: aldehyde ferredoxin oxidoreductase [Candidatus Abyssobacteria bacterium SURF_5]|uniref:Aldehyde ferredoxin oxidoreductase n=1 Tax=Abyssobacteria bacterium (strain SURF_5) TaxID=2093360 RepID=A0A3A4NVG5_ABYX5|nr:MAG: aldehyde ferredoxin oxidoreductase [Candidatus Abyssubacteria bacterium SURF_5]
MLHGYVGKLLYIDLSKESSKPFHVPEEILKKYIGGRGLGAKLYWDLLPPDAEPLGPKNVFMVLSGPVSGTMVPGAGKHVIVTRSPATGAWLDAYSSGRMAPEMKFAGYDGIIITGKARKPTYLLIQDEKVDFCDAAHLWGKGSFAAESFVKENFHPDCGCISIGPAGENLVHFACVGSEYFRKAGRGGAGAVMGSKNLKLVAVKGSGGITCANVQGVRELVLQHFDSFINNPVGLSRRKYGSPLTMTITNAAGMLPTRNFQKGRFEQSIGKIDKDAVRNAKIADRSCYACFASCGKLTEVKDGIFKGTRLEGPEYETLALLGSNLEIDYLPAVIKGNYLCDDLGLDTISAGGVIGFAMECFERGILTKEDTDGLELKFGNYEAALKLLELIAHRKGFGDFCARGVRDMAKELGRGTEAFAMHCKGMELPAYDPRAGWGAAITYSVTPRGGCHRRAWPPLREVLGGMDPFSAEEKAAMVRDMMHETCIMHSLLVCDAPPKIIPAGIPGYCQYLNLVTGMNYSEDDLVARADIIETLIRRINVRQGLGSEEDSLPKRILEESLPEGPPKGRVMGLDNFLKMRAEYYKIRGWDSEGVPTAETIAKYGFEGETNLANQVKI